MTRMNPSINLQHLKFFYDAVVYESISEAARMNYISQSAVSQAITKLETIFGVQLFFQNRQKLQVTEEGKIVFEQTQSIFKAVENTFQMVGHSQNLIKGNVRFVTTKSLGSSFIAPLYKTLKKNLPDIDFKFRMEGKNGIRNTLKREEVDFAIVVYDDQNFDQYEKIPLKKGVFQLYQSKNISPDIIHEGVFVYGFDCLHVPELKLFLEEKGIQNPIQDAIAGWDLVAHFVQLGIGVGFIPDYLISHANYPDAITHPLEIPTFEYEICAIHNKGAKLPRVALSFLEELRSG